MKHIYKFYRRTASAIAILLIFLPLSLQAQKNSFVCFSDLHFDPFLNSSLVDTLNKSTYDKWEEIFNTLDSCGFSNYGEDSSYRLFNSFLSGLKSVDADPRFIIFTGDFLTHHFLENFRMITKDTTRNASNGFILKTFRFIASKISGEFPTVPVYFTLGNNDSYTGDYNSVWNGEFFNETAPVLFDNFIMDNGERIKFLSYYSASGSYSVLISKENKQRLISLNANFLSAKCSKDQSVNGEKILKWLENELESAKKNNEKVWLVNHIPPGVDVYSTIVYRNQSRPIDSAVLFMTEKYNNELISIVKKYSDVITAGLSGHIHTDDFRLYKTQSDSAIAFIHIVPSVSPVFENNPAFQIFTYDENTFSILDYDTYYLNLDSTNPEWKFEYNFNATYGLNGLNSKTLNELSKNIADDDKTKNNYVSNYYSRSREASIENKLNAYLCGISFLTDSSYVNCYDSMMKKDEQKKTIPGN